MEGGKASCLGGVSGQFGMMGSTLALFLKRFNGACVRILKRILERS